MDKVTEVNIEGEDYGFVAGQTVKGVSGALSSDYVKHVILPEGAEVVEGMLVAVTFVNENTAGYSGEKTVYSTDGINFYWDSGYTQLITLPPQGCYTVTATETQYEYKLSEYPVLVMGDMTKPFCDSRGHPAGGKLWQAGDTVTVINLENRFIALQTTVNEIIQGSSLPVTSGAVYEKCNSLEPVNEVTSGNLHSVTSNAVAGSLLGKLNNTLSDITSSEIDNLSNTEISVSRISNYDIGWPSADGFIIHIPWSNDFARQIAIDDQSNWLAVRFKAGGQWFPWKVLSGAEGDDSSPVNISGSVSKYLGVDSVTACRRNNLVYIYINGTYTGSPTYATQVFVSGLPDKYLPKFGQTFSVVAYMPSGNFIYPSRIIVDGNSVNIGETSMPNGSQIRMGFIYIGA